MDPIRKAELDEIFAKTPYAIVEHLGSGAVADVFVVRQKFLGKKFALKLIRPSLVDEPGYLDRLRREARSLGSVDNPHVVDIVDLDRAEDGRPYVVLELLKGRTLSSELEEKGSLPLNEALAWGRQALSGLEAAHRRGLVHRDITPDNLFLQDKPGRPRILRVMDFGLVRVLPGSAASNLETARGLATTTNAVVGSTSYASPEAFVGMPLDERADLYSIGLVLFQMLTGCDPWDLDDVAELSDSELGALPGALERVVERALKRERAERYQSAREFRLGLEAASLELDL